MEKIKCIRNLHLNILYEHFVAKTQTGTRNTLNNIGIACTDCNTKKNSLDYIRYNKGDAFEYAN